MVKAFVHPQRVLRVITDFILFTRKDEELQKVVLRPHQMRAVERVQRRVKDPDKHQGLIWHTQGSGKTYTMITAAKKLIEDPALKNPTVLMLVDRNELEAQLFQNLEAVGFGHTEIAHSKRHLLELLESDQRGLIVSMIHKFDDIPADLSLRENIFVLVDEAHRTTGGELGSFLMGALRNATYIGFTGTPIDKTAHGKGTFKTFGSEDERGYIDKYSIRESIEEGATLPLHYALAPNELRVDRETLEREFLRLAILEGVSDIEVLNRVLERAVTLKNMLKNPDRIAKVAEYVADHFLKTVEPAGYKAFLVAPDREACTLYKEELDKHLPPEYSKVVISAAHNDPPELAKYHLGGDQEQSIRKSFRRPDELPKILIVTEKLLTGYDAPILYCMYLDKPMRDHVLLQAIARVNRPYEDGQRRKTAGFILDFVGIFEKLEDALAFDSEEVSGVVEGIEVLKKRFEGLIKEGRGKYLSVWAGLTGDKATEAVLEHFRSIEKREEFYKYFKDTEELFEILSPSSFLRPYLKDYDRITQVYEVLRAAYEGAREPIDKELLRKTARLVQEHTHTREIHPPKFEQDLTPEVLIALAEQDKPNNVKVFNLLVAIRKIVDEEGNQTPYLISIGEKAETIAEAFEEHLDTALEALFKLIEVVEEYKEIQKRHKQRVKS